jgi:ABC-type transport system involved in cytochrome bd biosynthesis fused ATPase/permease subunit
MTLSDLASVGSLVSAVAVVISLVCLASQVRQALRHPQAAIRAACRQLPGLFLREFAEWMDRTLAEVAPTPPIGAFAQWPAAVAEERGAETP